MNYTVFYSWQSDLPNATNRGFIQKALENAIKTIQADNSIQVEPVIDRDTAGVPGSPDIVSTIFGKIENAQIFVCDVSIINQNTTFVDQDNITTFEGKHTPRPTPNPNVLLELGYAMKVLGSRQIIMVMNQTFGVPELLPFDLRMRRVVTYRMPFDTEDRASERRKLESQLESGLRIIFEGLNREMPGNLVVPLVDDVNNLITKAQSHSVSLAQCIAEAMSLARKVGNTSLEQFCQGELSGWHSKQKEVSEDTLNYRTADGFYSFTEINSMYSGWGNDMSNAWTYMKENPKEFVAERIKMLNPVSYYENFPPGNYKALSVIESTFGAFQPDSQNPNCPVYIYFRRTAIQNILENIRTEFTKRLLELTES